MPRERVKHGKLWLHHPVPDGQASDGPGEPTTITEYYPGQPVEGDDKVFEDPSLDVTWNRDGGWVQMALYAPVDWWKRFMVVFGEGGDTTAVAQAAYTDVLTRSEINNLIKTLRRARDAAYGADE